jgi:hypothetical protein
MAYPAATLRASPVVSGGNQRCCANQRWGATVRRASTGAQPAWRVALRLTPRRRRRKAARFGAAGKRRGASNILDGISQYLCISAQQTIQASGALNIRAVKIFLPVKQKATTAGTSVLRRAWMSTRLHCLCQPCHSGLRSGCHCLATTARSRPRRQGRRKTL